MNKEKIRPNDANQENLSFKLVGSNTNKKWKVCSACSSKFKNDQALVSKKTVFVILLQELLKNLCHSVKSEPQLWHLIEETLRKNTANTRDNKRVDISAKGVLYSETKRYHKFDIQKCYETNEKGNRKPIINVEKGAFTTIILPGNRGMGRKSQKYYRKLSSKISEEHFQPYFVVST